ncbi:MAG: trypsin-like peptidase domain-containing protein [Sulfuricurvum sp.]
MNTQEILAKHINSIAQVSTPYGSGSGFLMQDLIITNSHVVSGLRECIISTKELKREVADVIYDDSYLDLAFIKPRSKAPKSTLEFATQEAQDGDLAIAIGHPYGLNYSTTEGIVSRSARRFGELEYIQIDTAINPGNSGGPLLDSDSNIIGINTFIIQNSNNLGFALPSHYIISALEAFRRKGYRYAIRCSSCKNIIDEDLIVGEYCPKCGSKLEIAKSRKEGYKPFGATKTIEQTLEELGVDVKVARRFERNWRVDLEDLIVEIAYFENGAIIADAKLCEIPKDGIDEIYSFLLTQNATLKDLRFSINQTIIYLSFVGIDALFEKNSAKKALQSLFENAIKYADILVNEFRATRYKKDEDE